MALILAGVSAYAAYKAMSEAETKMDPEINLEGKASVSFLPMELALGLMEAPIHTISFFDGNYNLIASELEERIEKILKENPWLGGWLCNDGKELKLWYDKTGEERTPGAFTLWEPGKIALSRDTPYIEYDVLLKDTGVKVPVNKDLLGKHASMWRVSLIPDSQDPNERFALVVSMSHIAGDVATFYTLFKMLCPSQDIVRMNPLRIPQVQKEVEDKMGTDDLHYCTKAISNPLWDFTQVANDPIQSSVFYISEYWLQLKREENPGVQDGAILAHVLFHAARPTVAFKVSPVRPLLADCSDLDAGNYQVSIPYTDRDYESPQLIQDSEKTIKRCGEFNQAPIPSVHWNSTFSVMTDWSRFHTSGFEFGSDIKEVMHMPLYSTAENKVIPSKLSLFCVFTASSSEKKQRLGAYVTAPRSIIQAVEASGIVDEPIAKC